MAGLFVAIALVVAGAAAPPPAPAQRPLEQSRAPIERHQFGAGISEPGWLGVRLAENARIVAVAPRGPAHRAGLREGDIIIDLNGSSAANRDALLRRLDAMPAGETIRLRYLRDGQSRDVEIVLAARR